MSIRPNNEKRELSDTKSVLRWRALKLRKIDAPPERLLKVKQEILQRIIQRLS